MSAEKQALKHECGACKATGVKLFIDIGSGGGARCISCTHSYRKPAIASDDGTYWTIDVTQSKLDAWNRLPPQDMQYVRVHSARDTWCSSPEYRHADGSAISR